MNQEEIQQMFEDLADKEKEILKKSIELEIRKYERIHGSLPNLEELIALIKEQ